MPFTPASAGPTRPASRIPLILLFTLICCPFLWGAAAATAAQEEFVDGVLHVKNSAAPSGGIETLTLEQMWQVGGEDDDDFMFGLISQALVDDENNVYLLDSQLNEVTVVSPAGEFLRTVGREGEGPGEFRMAFDMVFMPDGSLGVAQVFPGKLVQLNLDGSPAGEFRPNLGEATQGGFMVLVNCISAGGNLILTGIDMTFNQQELTQTRRYFLKSFNSAGTPLTHFHGTEIVWNFNDFTLKEIETDYLWGRVDVGTDGRVVAAAPRQGYELTVFNPDGSIDRIIERDYESWPRNDKATGRANAMMNGQLRQMPPGTEVELEDYEADIVTVFVRDDGTVWVQTSRAVWDPKPGVFTTFDVFNPKGEFIKQVDVVADGNAADDALLLAANDLVIHISGWQDGFVQLMGGVMEEDESGEEAAPMAVTCFRMGK
ncbi:MAG: 6-bladed beta-propeller [bacterium]